MLIVAENERVRRWARGRLTSTGFLAFSTDNGIDALLAARRDPPDLIVVDHVVGWLDVEYLVTRVREDAPAADIPILVITAGDGSVPLRVTHQPGVTSLVERGGGSTRDRPHPKRRR